jgi:hypothetical protein
MARDHINIRAGFDLASFSSSAQNLERELRATGQRLTRIGRNMSLAFSLPTLGAGVLATKEFAEFEQAMAKVNAVSGATAEEFDMLTTRAEELGRTTRYTAKEVAGLELSYAKLGFSADEIEKITEATLNLALATDEDLANSAMVAGNTLRGFALDASEMGRVVDVMAKSFTSSALDLEKWSVSTSKIASIASTLGYTLEEVAAMQGVLADTGIEASIIGTSLRTIFTTLAAKGMSYKDAMEKIANSQSKVNVAVELFDKRAANAAVILSTSANKYNRLKEAVDNAAGSSKEMGDIMNATLQMSMVRLNSAVEGLAIKFGEVLAPKIEGMVDGITNLAQKFSELSPNTKRIIVVVGALAVAIPPLIIVVGQLQIALAALRTETMLTIAPFLGFGAVIAAALAALMMYTPEMKKVQTSFDANAIATDRLKQATTRLNTETKNQIGLLKLDIDAIKNFNGTFEQRQKLIDDVNKKYGTTLQNLKDEKKFVAQLDSAYKTLSEQIVAKIKVSTFESEMEKLMAEQKKWEALITDNEKYVKRWEKSWQGGTPLVASEIEIQNAPLNEARANFEAVNLAIKELEETINNFGVKQVRVPDELGGGDDGASKEVKVEFKPFWNFAESGMLEDMQSGQQALEDLAAETFIATQGWTHFSGEMLEELGKQVEKIDPILEKTKERVKEFVTDLNQTFERGIEDMIIGTAEMFGRMLTDDAFTGKEFGKGILDMVATFMQQLGGLMVAFGVQFSLFEESIFSANPALAIAAGAAMIAAGAAIKGALNNGLDSSSTSVSTPSYASNSASYGGYEMENVIHLQGREMIIVQKRENSFRR